MEVRRGCREEVGNGVEGGRGGLQEWDLGSKDGAGREEGGKEGGGDEEANRGCMRRWVGRADEEKSKRGAKG